MKPCRRWTCLLLLQSRKDRVMPLLPAPTSAPAIWSALRQAVTGWARACVSRGTRAGDGGLFSRRRA